MQASLLRDMLVQAAREQRASDAGQAAKAGIQPIEPETVGPVEFQMPSRERAIRIQMAQGHDSPRIARELGLSQNEVDLVRAKRPLGRSA
jgi:FixJ family two-component response regulator